MTGFDKARLDSLLTLASTLYGFIWSLNRAFVLWYLNSILKLRRITYNMMVYIDLSVCFMIRNKYDSWQHDTASEWANQEMNNISTSRSWHDSCPCAPTAWSQGWMSRYVCSSEVMELCCSVLDQDTFALPTNTCFSRNTRDFFVMLIPSPPKKHAGCLDGVIIWLII